MLGQIQKSNSQNFGSQFKHNIIQEMEDVKKFLDYDYDGDIEMLDCDE